MDIKTIIVTILSLDIVNNVVISKVLGVPNALIKDTNKIKSLGLNMILTMVIAGPAGVATYNLLQSVNLAYLALPVTAVIVGAVAYCECSLCKVGKIERLLIVFNAAVIGTVINLAAENLEAYQTYLYFLAAGVSYFIGMYLYAGVRMRIDDDALPARFKGLPIDVLALGIIALAVLAFK